MKPRTRSDIVRTINCQPWAMAKEGEDMRPCMRHRIDLLWQGRTRALAVAPVTALLAGTVSAGAAVSQASKTLCDLGVRLRQ